MYIADKAKRWNTREFGKYATYPIMENGKHVANLECYALHTDLLMRELNKGNLQVSKAPFYLVKEYITCPKCHNVFGIEKGQKLDCPECATVNLYK